MDEIKIVQCNLHKLVRAKFRHILLPFIFLKRVMPLVSKNVLFMSSAITVLKIYH